VPHTHDLELLASRHGYTVSICRTCDIVHLDVGPVTLRLRPSALDSLAEVLARASAAQQQPTPEASSAPLELCN
jgi:hypothetical protein